MMMNFRQLLHALNEAVGLKVHILSDVSLIPHRGIMYCLDTQRIAGMVQPTNSDPSLAPAGKHLLISHQVIQSNNVEEERALALADLHMLFGKHLILIAVCLRWEPIVASGR